MSFKSNQFITATKWTSQIKKYITQLSCSEEFDNERAMFTAKHLRFVYHGDVKKKYIGAYDKSIEEIIHYVAVFKCN